jgi:hypothetical protein
MGKVGFENSKRYRKSCSHNVGRSPQKNRICSAGKVGETESFLRVTLEN